MLKKFILLIIILLSLQTAVLAQKQRFPKPEFEEGHKQPPTQAPAARSVWWEYVDVLVLIAALTLASRAVIKHRSRKQVLFISLFSVVYFGFVREGCVCSVGSLQNVALALFHPAYAIPISAVLFFAIPILYTLFYGRTFCAAVCPLGAVQDLTAFKPMELSKWLQKVLGFIPYIYLVLSILYAATDTDFIICRYDPYVGIFRLNAPLNMAIIGGSLVFIGIFIARPYCRFLCPYGVILNWVSRISKNHLSISPAACVQCKLCAHSCPFSAIDKPEALKIKENKTHSVRRYLVYAIAIPVFIALGALLGYAMHENLASVNHKVQLAYELVQYKDGMPQSLDLETFRSLGKTSEQLVAEASAVISKFKTGASILGGFLGLMFGLMLLSLSSYKFRTDYTANKGECVSCARCLPYCPVLPNEQTIK